MNQEGGHPVLLLDDVGKSFGRRPILSRIGMALDQGEVVLVAGANGAGKSTLLKIMAGVIQPSQGRVRWTVDQGMVGYMGHRTFLYPRLSAAENLRFWARLYGRGSGRDEILAALKRTGLAHVLHEPAGHFSRGMAQRLSLARMILLDPRVLLLDEPGTGLDRSSREMLRAEIVRARTEGKSVVWVSHDLESDLNLADRVLALADTRVVYLGAALDYRESGRVQ
jgi:heme exporter protein A